MALARFVKVGNISNLSDARYCAGMGVDLLGFRTISGHENYIAPKQFQEVRGWVTGPKVVAEIYGFGNQGDLEGILENYRPDLLELSYDELGKLQSAPIPLIVRVSGKDVASMLTHPLRNNIAYILIVDFKNEGEVIDDIPVMIEPRGYSIDAINPRYAAYGIALNGSAEIRPGLKSYEDLADILEKLDID